MSWGDVLNGIYERRGVLAHGKRWLICRVLQQPLDKDTMLALATELTSANGYPAPVMLIQFTNDDLRRFDEWLKAQEQASG